MNLWYRFVWILLQPLVKLYFRMSVEGHENMPKTGPVLLASNHCSHLDPPLIALSLVRQISFLAKKELFTVPVLGLMIRGFGAHPVSRGQGDTKAILTALRLLKQKKALLIFPEGTRSEDGKLQLFENGLAWLSMKSGVPVVPLYISGTYAAYPRGAWLPRPHKVKVRLGHPIYPEKMDIQNKRISTDDVRKYTDSIQVVMRDLSLQLEKSSL